MDRAYTSKRDHPIRQSERDRIAARGYRKCIDELNDMEQVKANRFVEDFKRVIASEEARGIFMWGQREAERAGQR